MSRVVDGRRFSFGLVASRPATAANPGSAFSMESPWLILTRFPVGRDDSLAARQLLRWVGPRT